MGCGKSTTAQMFRRLKIPVSEADRIVHQLYQAEDFLSILKNRYPGFFKRGVLQRALLTREAFERDEVLKSLEGLIHPLVAKRHQEFIDHHRSLKTPLIVLDVPLLFEIRMNELCDGVLVVDCPGLVAKERVLKRPHMTAELFEKIRVRQMEQEEKKRRADFILDTGQSRVHTFRALIQLLERACSTSWRQKDA